MQFLMYLQTKLFGKSFPNFYDLINIICQIFFLLLYTLRKKTMVIKTLIYKSYIYSSNVHLQITITVKQVTEERSPLTAFQNEGRLSDRQMLMVFKPLRINWGSLLYHTLDQQWIWLKTREFLQKRLSVYIRKNITIKRELISFSRTLDFGRFS